MKKTLVKDFITIVSFLLTLSVTGQVNAKDISQGELQQIMAANTHVILLDVRTPEEFAQGHVPNAINIPHTELETRLGELADDKDTQIIIYCRSGRRAEVARKILASNGFTKLDHLMGDFNDWTSNSLPVSISKLIID